MAMSAGSVNDKNWKDLIRPNRPVVEHDRDAQRKAKLVIEPLEHLVGLVTANARRDGTHPKAVGLEASNHQRHIALGLDAGLGDRISHKADLLTVLEGNARRLDGCGDHGHRKQ